MCRFKILINKSFAGYIFPDIFMQVVMITVLLTKGTVVTQPSNFHLIMVRQQSGNYSI